MKNKPKKVSEEKPRHTEIGQCTSSCRRVGCPDEDTKDLIKHYSKTFTDLAKHDTQPDSWEKEFDKEFNKELFTPEEGQEIMIDVSSAKVRSFISQLLSTERAKHQLFRKAEQEVFDETIAEARHEAYEGGYKEGQKEMAAKRYDTRWEEILHAAIAEEQERLAREVKRSLETYLWDVELGKGDDLDEVMENRRELNKKVLSCFNQKIK